MDNLGAQILNALVEAVGGGSGGGDKPPEDPNKPALPPLDPQSSANDPPGLDAKTPEQIARDAAAAVAATQQDTSAVAAGHEGVPFPATSDATAAPSAAEAARVDNSGWEFLLQDNARVEAAKAKWLADTKDNPLFPDCEATTEASVSPFDADREPPQNTRGSASEPPADTSQRHTVDNTSAEALQKMKR